MSAPRNFTKFFQEEREIYVQNVSNAQVSVEFKFSNGLVDGFLFANTRDPVNLTNHIPFEAVKQSMDFRKMLSRRPPALHLLDEEEYLAYFTNKAKNLGLADADAAIDAAEEKRRNTADRATRQPITDSKPEPIHEVVEKGSGPGGAAMFGERNRVAHSDTIGEEEIINPRVLHLCNQVKAELEPEERMPAIELLEALQEINGLGLDDYEYIRAHGWYKTVKKWARQQSSSLMEAIEAADGESDVDEASAVIA